MNSAQKVFASGPFKMHAEESICMHSLTKKCPSRKAFSLIELLTVVALFAILATATMPAIGNAASASRRTKYLNEISSLFEGARQYAVSKNTYVWVAFSDDASGDKPLYACVVASRNGLAQGYGSEDTWNSQVIDVSNNAAFTPVSKVVTLGDFRLNPADSLGATAQFRVKSGPKEVGFSRSVQFSPSGEARITSGIQGRIDFDTSATEGSMKNVKDTFSLNGPTGFLQFSSAK